MKNIAHVITRIEQGGTMDILFALLTLPGYKSTLILGNSSRLQQVRDFCKTNNIELIFVDNFVRNPNPYKDIKALLELYKIFQNSKFDIIHTHTSKAGFLGRFAAHLTKVPPVIHSTHGHVFSGYFGYFTNKLFIALEKIAAKWCKKIIALSKHEIKAHLSLNIGEKTQFLAIPNGIDMKKFKDSTTKHKKDFDIEENSFVIGIIARLTKIKGHKYLIEAISILKKDFPNICLLIIGDGELRESLEKQVKQLNLDKNVKFLGEKNDVPEILPLCDIVVLSSLNEGFGLSIIEAQASKVAVIATNVGGIPEVIKDGETGILIPPYEPNAIAGAIRRLITNEELKNNIREKARRFVETHFTLEQMLAKYDELYKSI